MIGSDASAVGALFSSSAFSPLYGVCMALVVNLHTVRYVSPVKAVTKFVGHFTRLSWALSMMTVTIFRAALPLIKPASVISLDYLAHETLKLHLIDGPVCFPHFSPHSRRVSAVVMMSSCCASLEWPVY